MWSMYTTAQYITTTAYIPFELVYGFRSEVTSTLRETLNVQYNYENCFNRIESEIAVSS